MGESGNSPHGNPVGMGISQKLGMGMGGNGNVESHSRTSLVWRAGLWHIMRFLRYEENTVR